MKTQTISQILNEYNGFDKAFWATYSIDFNTIDFLAKKDFKQIMSPYYFHLICDGNKLDESLDTLFKDKTNLSRLVKLQELCTISPQFSEGAFHPKILLFASEKSLLVIVSSANATPSGILSNQDLIGLFYYDKDKRDQLNEVTALFQYIRNFSGWGKEAVEDFTIIEERFDFLQDDIHSDLVFTIPHQDTLLSQIIQSLKNIDLVEEINIFSPFFDDNFNAISEIGNYFNKPLNIFSPQKYFNTTRNEKLPDNINFFTSDNLAKNSFHAKFYDFKCGDKSIVFWGSANCSYSGLLNNSRNYEVLLKCELNNDQIHSLWGDLEEKKKSNVEYGIKCKDNKTNVFVKGICIEGISVEDNHYTLSLDRPLNGEIIKGITYNKLIVDLMIKSEEGHFVKSIYEGGGLVILYIEKENVRISNFIYINNPVSINERILGNSNSTDFNSTKDNAKESIKVAFGFFNPERSSPSNDIPKSSFPTDGFWRLPKYAKKHNLFRIVNLEEFIKTRVVKFKIKTNRDSFEPNANGNGKKEKQNQHHILDIVLKETEKLLKNIIFIEKNKRQDQIDKPRWLKGLDLLNYFILNYLDESDAIFEVEKLNTLLLNTSRVSSWIALNLIEDDSKNFGRLELLRNVNDIFLISSVYEKLYIDQFSNTVTNNFENDKKLILIKNALFFQYITNHKFPILRTKSEHSLLTIDDFLTKLRSPIIASKAAVILKCENFWDIKGVTDVVVFKNKIEPMLYLNKRGAYMILETILGQEKIFTDTAPLEKSCIYSN